MPAITSKTARIVKTGASDGANNLRNALALAHISANSYNSPNEIPTLRKDVSIKWGCFDLRDPNHVRWGYLLNKNSSDTVLNKFSCLDVLRQNNVPIPLFTDSHDVANGWLQGGDRVYVRKLLRASAGDGIEVIEGNNRSVPGAPLYTKGLKGKRREYRIHVFKAGDIQRIFIQQKLRRQGFAESENYSNTVRNLENGWVFAHNEGNIQTPRQETIDAAIAAINAFDLNFGGVDVVEMDKRADGCAVLEINTAPGLQGATCDFYAEAITSFINGMQ